ncbi:MAG: hypothetical protein AB1810_04810 [Pseudomonadota bacterium]
MKSLLTSILSVKTYVAAVLLMSGCAGGVMAGDAGVTVEKVSSEVADVKHVWIKRDDGHTVIGGQITSRLHREGAIPGVVIIEVLGPDGKPRYQTRVDYAKTTTQSQSAKFSLPLDTALEPNTTVRVTHSSDM